MTNLTKYLLALTGAAVALFVALFVLTLTHQAPAVLLIGDIQDGLGWIAKLAGGIAAASHLLNYKTAQEAAPVRAASFPPLHGD